MSPGVLLYFFLFGFGIYLFRQYLLLSDGMDGGFWARPYVALGVLFGWTSLSWMAEPPMGRMAAGPDVILYIFIFVAQGVPYVPYFTWHLVNGLRKVTQGETLELKTFNTPAQAAEGAEDWDTAERLWREAIAADPKEYALRDRLARMLARKGEPGRAAAVMTRARLEVPELSEGNQTHAVLAEAEYLEVAGCAPEAASLLRYLESQGGAGTMSAAAHRRMLEGRMSRPPHRIEEAQESRLTAVDIEAAAPAAANDDPPPPGLY